MKNCLAIRHRENRCSPACFIGTQYSGAAFIATASATAIILLPVLFLCVLFVITGMVITNLCQPFFALKLPPTAALCVENVELMTRPEIFYEESAQKKQPGWIAFERFAC